MITITAHPKADKHHIVVEHFKSEMAAEQWKQVLKKNGWEVVQ